MLLLCGVLLRSGNYTSHKHLAEIDKIYYTLSIQIIEGSLVYIQRAILDHNIMDVNYKMEQSLLSL